MTRILMTDRDYAIIEFVKEFKCVSTTTLTRLFFKSQATAERRLKKLVECRKLYRTRESVISEYCYYIKRKPTNVKHCLIIADIYSRIKTHPDYQLIKYKREYELKYNSKSLRTDLMTVIKINNKLVPLLVEIDLTKKYKNKYSEYIAQGYYQQKFGAEPEVLVISDRTPESKIQIHWYKLKELD
jgi:hypothetical protein